MRDGYYFDLSNGGDKLRFFADLGHALLPPLCLCS